jgi:transposase-like protein|tara:strand:- start:762 stop:1052 length:291 start_codon:yes stop_codon:yes gene_type:complete
MKYRKWDSKTKAKIVLESLQNKIPLAELCNRHQITQSLYYYWLNEFQSKSHEVFNTTKKSKKERRLTEENKELKRIIADLTIELKKSELELEGEDL